MTFSLMRYLLTCFIYRLKANLMRSSLLCQFPVRDFTRLYVPSKVIFNLPVAAYLCTKPVTPDITKSVLRYRTLIQVKRSFMKMECCGTSCSDFSKEALKQRLTSQQYQVTQEKDTERAFTGKYHKHFEKGTYTCVVCNQDIFPSEAKYDSKCGWPAFFDVVDSNCVKYKEDLSHDMKRTEVACSNCGAHLGHVFNDGPKPTGKRYCINSAALNFRKSDDPESTSSTPAS